MTVTLFFFGAAGTVTGSRYLLETPRARILIDCGLFQERGNAALNWEDSGIDPAGLDAILLTHGHLDHCGWLPKLVKEGYDGPVYATPATADLAPIILRDTAHIQEEDARTKAKRHRREKRRDVRPALPLYGMDEAERAIAMLRHVPRLGAAVDIAPGIAATWNENGHILGATWVGLEAEGLRIVFSGDIGRWNRPILHDPEPPPEADYLVIESTYGDRVHINADTEKDMGEVLDEVARKGGNLLIPSFSVERAQELLYSLSRLGEKGRLRGMAVHLDSPMASRVTDLFKKHPEECDEEMLALIRAGKSPFAFAELRYVSSVEESKRLNSLSEGQIIIAGNGMCTGGRIKHHLVHNLGRPEATVLFAGFQAPGTLGRQLVDGAREVRLFNRPMSVRADIRQLAGLSGHADQNELVRWAGAMRTPPKHCFVTHGDPAAATALAEKLHEQYGWTTSTPALRDRVDLA